MQHTDSIKLGLDSGGAGAVLEVDLAALRHNVQQYRAALRPGVKLAVMVKANAYGAGAGPVAKALEGLGVDYLGVAQAQEGLDLRAEGVACPIMVFNTTAQDFPILQAFHLSPVLYDLPLFRAFGQWAKQSAASVPVHLELNTGMNRLGIDEAELPELIDLLRANRHLRVESIFSHLAASNSAAEDSFSQRQAEQYLRAYQQLSKVIGYAPMRHLLNSNGIVRLPQYQMDMVRLGLGAYGVDGSGHLPLQPVMNLRARLLQIREVPAGETIGYGRAGQAGPATRIATVGIGYADGLRRSLGNGRYSLGLHGQLAPIVGQICMDVCMIEVGHIGQAKIGDYATVFGEKPSVQEMSRILETIPYECFASLGSRVCRLYRNAD